MKDSVKLKQDNKLDEYLTNLIGSIDYSNVVNCNQKYIKEIEKARITQAKYAINSIINGTPKDKISYIYTKDTRGFTPIDEMDLLDIEIVLNSAVLTMLRIIKNKNELIAKRSKDAVIYIKDISTYSDSQLMVYTTDIYNSELERLIEEKEKLINTLLETNQPTINDPTELSELQHAYYKTYKNSCN